MDLKIIDRDNKGQLMKTLALVILGAVLVGCTAAGHNPTDKPKPAATSKGEVYKVGKGDALSISVWRNPELSVNVPVRPDGMISVPLIGDIDAADKEPEQLADEIKNELANYIKNPQVTVVVTNAVSSEYLHRVRVTGAVNQPQSIPYSNGMTVMDVVLVSGGLTEFAKANETKLYRNTVEGPKVYRVRLGDILEQGNIATNYELQPGDIVTVPERLF